jgi:hypothetical protein
MSTELLETLNRRTAVAAVRAEASRAGVDAEQLLDSKTSYGQVTGLDVGDAGFPRRVADLVREHARPGPAQASPALRPGLASSPDPGSGPTPTSPRRARSR